jgi:hypothetical protein
MAATVTFDVNGKQESQPRPTFDTFDAEGKLESRQERRDGITYATWTSWMKERAKSGLIGLTADDCAEWAEVHERDDPLTAIYRVNVKMAARIKKMVSINLARKSKKSMKRARKTSEGAKSNEQANKKTSKKGQIGIAAVPSRRLEKPRIDFASPAWRMKADDSDCSEPYMPGITEAKDALLSVIPGWPDAMETDVVAYPSLANVRESFDQEMQCGVKAGQPSMCRIISKGVLAAWEWKEAVARQDMIMAADDEWKEAVTKAAKADEETTTSSTSWSKEEKGDETTTSSTYDLAYTPCSLECFQCGKPTEVKYTCLEGSLRFTCDGCMAHDPSYPYGECGYAMAMAKARNEARAKVAVQVPRRSNRIAKNFKDLA